MSVYISYVLATSMHIGNVLHRTPSIAGEWVPLVVIGSPALCTCCFRSHTDCVLLL